MQGLVYADLTRQRLTKTAGGSTFQFPELVAGDELRLGLRLTESVDGQSTEVSRSVVGLKASLGFVDLRPTGGNFKINFGPSGSPTFATSALAYDVTAGDFETVLGAYWSGSGTMSVEAVSGGFIISNSNGVQLDISSEEVDLDPISFVEIREFQQNGSYKYEVRLVQAPIASTSSFLEIVPPAPSVEVVRAGGSDAGSGAAWNEIQALNLDPTFRGTYQIRRGYRRTALLSIEDGVEEIAEALNSALKATDGEVFVVTNPNNNVAHIEFTGDAGGVGQDLLVVDVFSAPAGDPTFVLDLNTHDLFAALRGANEIKPQLEIELVLDDENGGAEDFTVTVCRQVVKVIDEINKESNSTAQNIDWLREPDGLRYQPYGSGQVITGSQHWVGTFGDNSNSTFNFAHNLNTSDLHVTVRNNSTGAVLEGADYNVVINGDNDIDVVMASAPANNGAVVVITTAGPVSAFEAHNHAIAEVTGLQDLLDDLGLRLEVIEGLVPTGAISNSISETTGQVAKWKLPSSFEIFPKKGTEQDVDEVNKIDVSALPRKGARLLPAAFDVLPTYVTSLPGSPVEGRVYCLASGELTLPGYGGIRSRTIKPLDKFSWDGKGYYAVENVFSEGAEFFLESYSAIGDEEVVLDFVSDMSQLGENQVGIARVRYADSELAQVVDGWYPFKSDAVGNTMTVSAPDLAGSVPSSTGTFSDPASAVIVGNNMKVDVTEVLVEGGGTTLTFTLPGTAGVAASSGLLKYSDMQFSDDAGLGLVSGIRSLYSLGDDSNEWVAVTSGLVDGSYTIAATAELPKNLQSMDTVNSGEINRFYPVDFKRELFKVHVNENQLRLKSTLALDFALETAAFMTEADVQWGIIVQTGELYSDLKDVSGAGEGAEIAGVRWNKPSLDQVIHLSDVTSQHAMGLRVYRSADNVITCSSVKYGQEYGGEQAPSQPNFVVRGLLHRFDVAELSGDATGLVAYSGMSVDSLAEGEAVITA